MNHRACGAWARTVLLGGRLGQHDPDHPVAADAASAVREGGGELAGEAVGAVEVGNEDEVVLGAMPLGEGDPVSHGPIVLDRGPRSGRLAQGSLDEREDGVDVAGPVGSNQVIRGSGRNHDSWRRANRRVAVAVATRRLGLGRARPSSWARAWA